VVGFFTVNISDIIRRLRARAHTAGIDLSRPFFFRPMIPDSPKKSVHPPVSGTTNTVHIVGIRRARLLRSMELTVALANAGARVDVQCG
jgi:hypothetical protein